MFQQILYNVEDYAGAGGIVSSDTSFIPHTQSEYDNENSSYTKVDIFSKTLLEDLGISNISKIGIQAPPGTKFWLNTTTETDEGITSSEAISTHIMIGRTGVYELEVPNFNIDILYFEHPVAYTLDVDMSNKFINQGKTLMKNARMEFEAAYAEISTQLESAISTNTNSDFWNEYEDIHNTYVTAYEEGRAIYIQGMAGVYNVDENAGRDLYNIIIDFIYDSPNEEVN